jgi:hypothetical protein
LRAHILAQVQGEAVAKQAQTPGASVRCSAQFLMLVAYPASHWQAQALLLVQLAALAAEAERPVMGVARQVQALGGAEQGVAHPPMLETAVAPAAHCGLAFPPAGRAPPRCA